ncbi:patatin-like phospholipase family protein [Cytophagaceae bacterium ABcell3]|nr:patatin-like phospholipase family protein [Cytophagaceae bacterium ABcell3]
MLKRLKNIKAFVDAVRYSFPFQLLLNHFKKNQIFLLIWLLLFAFITQNAGNMFGIPYLFLDPEYMYKTSARGFFILGIALGIFIMSFHITTYILDSYRFSFLGTVPRPFTKFCINNSIIPLVFIIVYLISIIQFQLSNGFQPPFVIILEVLSLLFGILITVLIMFSYFWSTNKDIFKLLAGNLNTKLKQNTITRVNVLRKYRNAKKDKYFVTSYLSSPISIAKVPEYNSFDKQLLFKVFDQNHLNAVIVEIFIIVLVIVLGMFRDIAFFQIPAGASAILFLAILIMITGAFSFWLRGWAISTIILMLITINFLVKNEIITTHYQAFGINYQQPPVDYNLEKLQEITNPITYQEDYNETIKILENWRKKFPENELPKMVLLCTSGGGQRAAVWTTRTLQHVDSTLNGSLFKHSALITGASGGLIGASYFRELYLRKQQGENINIYSEKYLDNISRDVLNPIIFSMVVNDFFIRFQRFSDGKYTYIKDRGYAFEHQVHTNTQFKMDKRLRDYKEPEQQATIPMLIMSPTVINDGRKLYISPQNISYMSTASTVSEKQNLNAKIKGIEFRRMFDDHDADNLHFMSGLRMSATFPYITPNVELPSKPAMEIMDAGISDNFGIHDAVRFLYVFREWIKENTSGVVVVSIRDCEKDVPIEKRKKPSIFTKWMAPIGSIYNNWDYLQDFNNDNLLEYAHSWFGADLNVVEFEYIPKPKLWGKLTEKKINPDEVEAHGDKAALSWHLTTREKESLTRTIHEGNNQAALSKLKILLKSR